MFIENGVGKSVTLFLVAMAKITNQNRQPVEIVGYADDWPILTSDWDMETAEINMQTALNGVAKWTRQKWFTISPKKQYACRYAGKRLTIIETWRFNWTDAVWKLKTHTCLG
jgi:hypothetical protein